MNKTLLACALAIASIGSAAAANIIPVNFNEPGVGLNDPTPATPVGGNPGETIGEQRQFAYQFAADLWGAVLESEVDIRVRAQFTPLSCTATSGVLGSAVARFIQRDFNGAVPETWYGEALANAISGQNLSPTEDEINSNFNSNLGTPGCLENSSWYYGIDGNTPPGAINFLDVVMHEIAHGLNFQGFYNVSTGAPQSGFADIYSRFVFDNTSGMFWTDMTNAQRVTAVQGNNLVWTGANVTAAAPAELGAQVNLVVAGSSRFNFEMVPAQYGPTPTPANFGPDRLVLARDASGSTLGCAPFAANAYTGLTVLIDRGSCSFKTKTLNAQNAGAAKVIIANNVAAGFPGMGDDPTVTATITIPSVGITRASGTLLKKSVRLAIRPSLQAVPGQFAGTDPNGLVYMYAPSPIAPGSSFSHFDVRLTPNALMEPSINDSLDASMDLDLTPALFQDLGWELTP